MKFKVGDKVKLNKEIKKFRWGMGPTSYDEIGFIKIANPSDGPGVVVDFPSCHNWNGLEKELVLVSKVKHFKSLPNDYTGTIEVENGFIQEREILDEVEKRYLKGVIRPFKNRVINIRKRVNYSDFCYILIRLKEDLIILPNFKKGTMYNGMEEGKGYTLKELGLDE